MNPPHDGRYFLKPCPPELLGTPEGIEYERIRSGARKSFQQRLEAIGAMKEQIDAQAARYRAEYGPTGQ